jgi:hypothetical protein
MIRRASVACALLVGCVACLAFAAGPDQGKNVSPSPSTGPFASPYGKTLGGQFGDKVRGNPEGQFRDKVPPQPGNRPVLPPSNRETGARDSTYHIDGMTQTLSTASFADVRSAADLLRGPRVLGRFQTESASRLLPPGDYDLVLTPQGTGWGAAAVSRGGDGAVYQATRVAVQVRSGVDRLPPNELRKGSFLFILYYPIYHPVWLGSYYDPLLGAVVPSVVWVMDVVEVLLYFP